MKLRNVLVLLFAALAIACEPNNIDPGLGDGDTGGDEIVNPSDPSDPSDPSNPSDPSDPSDPALPTEPAYISFASRIVVAGCDGVTERIVVDVDPAWEWQITSTGEGWLTAERVGDDLVVNVSASGDCLQREGVVTVAVGVEDNIAEASIRVWQVGTDTEELIYEVETTTANQKIVAAPILTSANGGKMKVDWGDGSALDSFESARAAHFYARPGRYTIIIEGEDIHNLEFSDGSHICSELKRIHSWGKMGYKNAANMCKGCVNLESIPDDLAGSFANVGSFVAAFLGCESLKAIPEGLFRYATEAKKFANCFRYTASIREIPAMLFANTPQAEEFYYTFYGTGTDFQITDDALVMNAGNYKSSYPAELEQSVADGNLRTLPEGLFANCPNALRFEYIFGATAITALPEGLFAANSNAENYEGVCYACVNLKAIPARLMKNATSAINIKYMFAGCTSLTEIPVAIFENCSEVTNLEALFYYATGIKSAKRGIFKGLSKVKTIGSVFHGCASLTDVEAGLFEGLTSAKSFRFCFSDCTSLRTIPSGLLAGMSAAYDFESMFANTALESVPEGLFDEVRDYDLANYGYLFSDCKNLKTVPARLFDHVTDVASDGFCCLFDGSGIESIPAGLFASCTGVPATAFEGAFMNSPELRCVEGSIFPEGTSVTSMKQLFYNCPKLESIPADLFVPLGEAKKLNFAYSFAGCTSLRSLPEGLFAANTKATNFQHTFTGCTALTTIPATLLSACAEVTNVQNLFSGCSSLAEIPATLFAGCKKIQYFEYTFADCVSLTAIPETLFSAIGTTTTSVSFLRCFSGCVALKSIPAGLFDTVRRISNLSNCFRDCTALSGESPYTIIGGEKVHLYERVQGEDFPRVPSNKTAHEGCFKGCTGLSDYAAMPKEWVEIQ